MLRILFLPNVKMCFTTNEFNRIHPIRCQMKSMLIPMADMTKHWPLKMLRLFMNHFSSITTMDFQSQSGDIGSDHGWIKAKMKTRATERSKNFAALSDPTREEHNKPIGAQTDLTKLESHWDKHDKTWIIFAAGTLTDPIIIKLRCHSVLNSQGNRRHCSGFSFQCFPKYEQ